MFTLIHGIPHSLVCIAVILTQGHYTLLEHTSLLSMLLVLKTHLREVDTEVSLSERTQSNQINMDKCLWQHICLYRSTFSLKPCVLWHAGGEEKRQDKWRGRRRRAERSR